MYLRFCFTVTALALHSYLLLWLVPYLYFAYNSFSHFWVVNFFSLTHYPNCSTWGLFKPLKYKYMNSLFMYSALSLQNLCDCEYTEISIIFPWLCEKCSPYNHSVIKVFPSAGMWRIRLISLRGRMRWDYFIASGKHIYSGLSQHCRL